MINNIICACSSNYTIGKDNKMPWQGDKKYKWDMQHFKKTTIGKNVIMGYNTFKSMDFRPLESRNNFIISNKHYGELSDRKDIRVFKSLSDALVTILLERSNNQDVNSYIIGGESLYIEALKKNLVNSVILTVFDDEYSGDKFFPIDMLNEKFEIKEVVDMPNGKIYYYSIKYSD